MSVFTYRAFAAALATYVSIGIMHTVLSQCNGQRTHDMLLPSQLKESLQAPLEPPIRSGKFLSRRNELRRSETVCEMDLVKIDTIVRLLDVAV